jgi:hypothetical protein
MLSAQLEEAYRSKKRKYSPVSSALHHYIREGWTIEILPLVIGISGLTNTASLQKALSFLDISQQKWRDVIKDSVLASGRALAYMHKVPYSSNNRQPTMDKVDQQVANTRNGRKRRRPMMESLGETQLCWKKLTDNTKWIFRAGGGSTPSTLSSHLKKARERRGEG